MSQFLTNQVQQEKNAHCQTTIRSSAEGVQAIVSSYFNIYFPHFAPILHFRSFSTLAEPIPWAQVHGLPTGLPTSFPSEFEL